MIRRATAHLLSLLLAIPAALWIARREKLIQRNGRTLLAEERAFAKRLGRSQSHSRHPHSRSPRLRRPLLSRALALWLC